MTETTKEDVRQFIKTAGPVSRDDVLQEFDAVCKCCGSEASHAGDIDDYRIQLLDENRIATNAEWEYFVP